MSIKDRHGRITPYGFSCGYVERADIGGIWVELSSDGPGHGYRVRAYGHGVDVWHNILQLKAARQDYALLKRFAAVHLASRVLDP